MPRIEIPELDAAFVFRRRPVAIPGDLRPSWRIGLLVQLLRRCCRGGRSTLARLHVLSWGIRTKESRRQLQDALNGHAAPDCLIVRLEPFLNRAVDLAIGEDVTVHGEGAAIGDRTHGECRVAGRDGGRCAKQGGRVQEVLGTRVGAASAWK